MGGSNTLPGGNSTNSIRSSAPTNTNVTQKIEFVLPLPEEEEKKINQEDGRILILKKRAMIVRRRIARPRLKVLLSKMRSALSSWYNHDRHIFLIRHGGSKQSLSKVNGPNPISI